MLKYQTTNGKHSVSSPHIDLLFSMAKMTTASKQPHLPSEKEQMDSIRTMGKYLFREQTDSTVTFEQKGQAGGGEKGRSGGGKEQGLNIYERGQISERKKYEKIVNAHRTEAQRILELSKTTSNTLNASKTNILNKSGSSHAHPTTYKTKESFMIKELLKRCIKQEQQLHQVRERQKKLQPHHSKSYLNQTTRERSPQPKMGKRIATKKELQMIFEEVNQRSVELKKRKETKVQQLQEEKYEREMKGVTFHPQLQSSKSLRNSCTQGFLRRLHNDHQSREYEKVQILAEQLRKDPFEPRLNSHRNSLSKSKVHSFRIEDSAFLTARSKPELIFEKNLSRFIYPEEDQLTESREHSVEIAMKANELQFLFE